METQKTVSLPIDTWVLIEAYGKETHQDINRSIEVLLRHGYIRAMALVKKTKEEGAIEASLLSPRPLLPLRDEGVGV